jgi:hypothetical protein
MSSFQSPHGAQCSQNAAIYAADFGSTNVRASTAFTWEKAFEPLAQLADQLTLNHRNLEANRPTLLKTLRIILIRSSSF